MKPSQRTLQEARTTLAPEEVLKSARIFFSRRNGIYSSFLDMEGPGYCTFRGQGGEELIVAAQAADGVTRVTGSTYLFDMQLSRFFATLPAAPAAPVREGATEATA